MTPLTTTSANSYTDLGLDSEKTYYYGVTAVDDIGNEIKSVQSVAGKVDDTIAPIVSIASPLNQLYHSTSILLSYNVNEVISSCWYILNNDLKKLATGNATYLLAAEGANSLVLYCNDSSGNIGINTTA